MTTRVTTNQTTKANAAICKMYNFQRFLSPKSSNTGFAGSHVPAFVKTWLNLPIAQTALW